MVFLAFVVFVAVAGIAYQYWRSMLSNEAQAVHAIVGEIQRKLLDEKHRREELTDLQRSNLPPDDKEFSFVGKRLDLTAKVANVDASGEVFCYTHAVPVSPRRSIAFMLPKEKAATLRKEQTITFSGILVGATMTNEYNIDTLRLVLRDVKLS